MTLPEAVGSHGKKVALESHRTRLGFWPPTQCSPWVSYFTSLWLPFHMYTGRNEIMCATHLYKLKVKKILLYGFFGKLFKPSISLSQLFCPWVFQKLQASLNPKVTGPQPNSPSLSQGVALNRLCLPLNFSVTLPREHHSDTNAIDLYSHSILSCSSPIGDL